MSLNSVNTNVGAMIALESLNKTNASLGSTEKQVSTGLRVADSTDDGAAYAVAQSVRSSVGGLTTANQQLGNVQGLLSTTQSGMNDISNTMASMRDVLVTLSDSNVSGNERTQYQAQYQSLLANVKSDIQDASYGGKTHSPQVWLALAPRGTLLESHPMGPATQAQALPTPLPAKASATTLLLFQVPVMLPGSPR